MSQAMGSPDLSMPPLVPGGVEQATCPPVALVSGLRPRGACPYRLQNQHVRSKCWPDVYIPHLHLPDPYNLILDSLV